MSKAVAAETGGAPALVSRELPPVPVSIQGPVETYNWLGDQDEHKQAALRFTESICHGPNNPTPAIRPLLLQGAALEWPATELWSLDWLAANHGSFRGMVRISPSMDVKYCNSRLSRLLTAATCGSYIPTSATTMMSMAEFAMRLRADCPQPSLRYPGQEFCYMQAAVPKRLLKDIQPDQHWAFNSRGISAISSINVVTGWLQMAGDWQPRDSGKDLLLARMWVSPAGTVSPLHYDIPDSILTQIRGRKRLLLWQREDLHRLYTYPMWHPLFRRSRVNPVAPDLAKYPLYQGVAVYEALLNPGDLLFIPSCWAHYTESLDMSISISTRLPLRGSKATGAWLRKVLHSHRR
ncbi:hypothetical protein WJX72_003966 [[Myrmecia] bisecta]|uniref:JmjC domain-containing protein n=1 Tax=[Myrmecia] bisecta TaxID=41462 RepID=A0AAW1Q8P4_9CHLO